ncbi:MAG: hypothetical protein GEV08_03515 [Acidimicrobiia bacterium]|nr:hypothetical protein [Acidimicrobiia bacterium]
MPAWLARPPAVLVRGLAALLAALVEGAPPDWSGAHLAERGVADGLTSPGVVAFWAGMLAGRLVGAARRAGRSARQW